MKECTKKIVSLVLAFAMMVGTLVFAAPKVYAASNAEIRNQIIALLYNNDGGHMSCDFDGYVTTNGRHEGIDFTNSNGHAVYAILGGEVTAVRGGNGSLSTIAVYNSQYNVTILYLHTNNFKVNAGQTINTGTQLACESNQGATAAHTHVELKPGRQTYASNSLNDPVLNNPNPYPYYDRIFGGGNPQPIVPPTPPTPSDVVHFVDGSVTSNGFSVFWNFGNCSQVVVNIKSIALNQVVGSLTLPNDYTYNFGVGDASWGNEYEVSLIPNGDASRTHYLRYGDKENRVVLPIGGTPAPVPQPVEDVVQFVNSGVTANGFSVYWKFADCNQVVVNIKSIALNQVIGSLTRPNDYTYNFGVGDTSWGNEFEVSLIPNGDASRTHYLRYGDKENRVILPVPQQTDAVQTVYRITSVKDSTKCLGITNNTVGNGSNVELQGWNNRASQVFMLVKTDGKYAIYSPSTNFVMGVTNDQLGANVQLSTWSESNTQLWTLEDAGNGDVYIKSALGNYLLLNEYSTADGTNILAWTLTGDVSQKFHLEPLYQNEWLLYDPLVFSTDYYRLYNPELADFSDDALRWHWANYGIFEGRQASPVFSINFYKEQNPGLVQALGDDNLQMVDHFIMYGQNDDHLTSPTFNPKYYIEAESNSGVKDAALNDAAVKNGEMTVEHYGNLHYMNYGIAEDRPSSPIYNPGIYAENYADLYEQYGENWKQYAIHFANKGYKDGRQAASYLTLTFDPNGGTVDRDSQVFGFKKTFGELPTATREGYEFIGWFTEKEDGAQIIADSVAVSKQSMTVYARWALPESPETATLSSISIESQPTKTVYEIGESLNTSGLKLTLHYSDSTTESVTSGYTTSGFSSATAGTKTITVTYGGCSTTFSVTVNAKEVVVGEDDPQIVIDSKTARAGETVQVAIVLKNADKLKSIALSDFAYDADKLELLSGEWKLQDSVLSDVSIEEDVAGIGFKENTDCNGSIFVLSFKVKAETEDGAYPVSCEITAKRMDSGIEKSYPIAVVSGSIQVVSVIQGDTNGDNVVTSDDAIYLLYHTLLPNRYPINQNADFNGDGVVTSDDAIYLLYHTLLPARYPLK